MEQIGLGYPIHGNHQSFMDDNSSWIRICDSDYHHHALSVCDHGWKQFLLTTLEIVICFIWNWKKISIREEHFLSLSSLQIDRPMSKSLTQINVCGAGERKWSIITRLSFSYLKPWQLISSEEAQFQMKVQSGGTMNDFHVHKNHKPNLSLDWMFHMYGNFYLTYCIRGNFRGGFVFVNFTRQTAGKFPLHYNVNIVMKTPGFKSEGSPSAFWTPNCWYLDTLIFIFLYLMLWDEKELDTQFTPNVYFWTPKYMPLHTIYA